MADACAQPSTGNLREAMDVENQLKRSKLYYLELNAVPAQLASVQSDEPTTATGQGRGATPSMAESFGRRHKARKTAAGRKLAWCCPGGWI